MPGGRNSYTRPANKPQRAAMKRQKARNAAIDNLNSRRAENAETKSTDKFLENDANLRSMIADLEAASLEDRVTMRQGVEKAKKRKDNRYNYAKGGAVRAYANGGAVMSGRGPKFKGSS
jgi:hypothetical protein